jgi:ribokinase
MRPRIVVIGSANTDLVVKAARLPAPGETVLGGEYHLSLGGKGANQAVAAARLGARVTLVARLGRDAFGRQAFAAYQAEGIDLGNLVWDESAPSGIALIMVDQAGENMICVAPGANARLSPGDVLAAEPAIRGADCVLLQLEIPLETVQTAVDLAVSHHVRVILNPAPAAPLPRQLLEQVDVLTPNQREAAALAGGDAPLDAGELIGRLKDRYRLKNLVMTLGKEGAMLYAEKPELIPPYPVTPLDTVGAGDAFNGALGVALARGDPLPQAVQFANAAAALSTTRLGAQAGMPTAKAVKAFMKQYPRR